MSTHRLDGYLLISEGLAGRGYIRSPSSVKTHALRELGIALSMYPADGLHECSVCGRWYARPNTQAGRAGMCEACWKKRKTEAYREGMAEREATAEYEKLKKRVRDARKAARARDYE